MLKKGLGQREISRLRCFLWKGTIPNSLKKVIEKVVGEFSQGSDCWAWQLGDKRFIASALVQLVFSNRAFVIRFDHGPHRRPWIGNYALASQSRSPDLTFGFEGLKYCIMSLISLIACYCFRFIYFFTSYWWNNGTSFSRRMTRARDDYKIKNLTSEGKIWFGNLYIQTLGVLTEWSPPVTQFHWCTCIMDLRDLVSSFFYLSVLGFTHLHNRSNLMFTDWPFWTASDLKEFPCVSRGCLVQNVAIAHTEFVFFYFRERTWELIMFFGS